RVSTRDNTLDDTVLFKHRLRYEWHFKIQPQGRLSQSLRQWLRKWPLRRMPQKRDLSPISAGPQVVQYSPWPGTITPSVTIRRDGDDSVEVSGSGLQVNPS